MWFLKSLKTEDVVHYLLAGEEYVVGRRDATIIIMDDPSISRKHAVFLLSHPEVNLNDVEKLPIVTVKDSGSKYGTYLNKDKQIGSEGVILKIGDRITFGQCNSSYELCHKPILINTSCIEGEDKKSLKQLIWKLGGHIVSAWQNNCTHLVMKEIKVTIKAVCAMVSLTPIVTAMYFEDLLQAIREKKNHPDVEQYIPKCGEPLLTKENVSFGPNPNRAKLFESKTFICMSQKQFKKLHVGISLASGTVTLLDKDDDIKMNTLLHPNTIIMKYQSDSTTVPSPGLPLHIQNIEHELKKNKKRTIPESDIGLAVVYCSTSRYCNPSFNLGNNLFNISSLQSQTFTQENLYIEGTRSTQSSTTSKARCGSFVEESLERNCISPVKNSPSKITSRKRDREEEIESEPSIKHTKLEDANKFTPQKAIKSKSTVPISPENELSKKIKVENTTICPSLQTFMHDYVENELTECIQTQVSKDPLDCSVLMENSECLHKSTLNCKNEVIERVQSPVLEDIPDNNGFISKPKRDNSIVDKSKTSNSHDELPSRLVNVEYAALCPPRNNRPTEVNIPDLTVLGTIRNFKKFQKVYSSISALPHIIGGRDLIAYDKSSSKALDEWLSQNPETQPEREEVGLFDWDNNSSVRRR